MPEATTSSSEASQPSSEDFNKPKGPKYLDPETLSQIGSLDIVARRVVEGLRIGQHKSPSRGISSEFTAYRQYSQGDETRNICLLYTSPSPRDATLSRMPSSA